MKDFGNRLRKTMIEKNMTGFELSQKLEVTPSMISNYISGRRFPGFYSLKKLAQALDVSIDYLLGLNDEKTIEPSGDIRKEEHDISEEEAKLRFVFDCLTEGDYQEAKEAYESLNTYKLKGMALYETALLSLLMQKEKKAIELLERFNSFNLQESCGLSKLGDIYRACGDLERAKDYYTKALKRNEKDSKATENLGEIAIFKGDYTEAYFWYDKLARDYPLEAKAYLRIGEILGELGRSLASRRNFLAGVILNACSSEALEITTDTFDEVLGEEIKKEELIEAIEAVRKNGDRERRAVQRPSSQTVDPSFERALRSVLRSDASRPGSSFGRAKTHPASSVQDHGLVLGEREDHRELEIKREGERGENSRPLVSEANSRSFSALTNNLQPKTHNGSQEHTPRRQEHAATPLKRGLISRAEEHRDTSIDEAKSGELIIIQPLTRNRMLITTLTGDDLNE